AVGSGHVPDDPPTPLFDHVTADGDTADSGETVPNAPLAFSVTWCPSPDPPFLTVNVYDGSGAFGDTSTVEGDTPVDATAKSGYLTSPWEVGATLSLGVM